MTPTIQLNGVSKFFGNIIALKDISFKAYRGQVTALLGDNGAGKSTLIKILSGVYIPDEGDILIDGTPVKFRSQETRRCLALAQSIRIWPCSR